uniref:UspA domain-containing protein n=1 Tax=Macrostomum lignano TaxID=282301 RepID=A0A1I8FMT5_9PLAT
MPPPRLLRRRARSTTPAIEKLKPVGSVSCLAVRRPCLTTEVATSCWCAALKKATSHLIEVSKAGFMPPSARSAAATHLAETMLSPALRAGYRLAPNAPANLLIADNRRRRSQRGWFQERADSAAAAGSSFSQIGSLSLRTRRTRQCRPDRARASCRSRGARTFTLCVGERPASDGVEGSLPPTRDGQSINLRPSSLLTSHHTEISVRGFAVPVPSASASALHGHVQPSMAACCFLTVSATKQKIWSLAGHPSTAFSAWLSSYLTNDAAEEVDPVAAGTACPYIVNHQHKEVVKSFFNSRTRACFSLPAATGFNGRDLRDLPSAVYGYLRPVLPAIVMYTGICLEAIPAYPLALGASDDGNKTKWAGTIATQRLGFNRVPPPPNPAALGRHSAPGTARSHNRRLTRSKGAQRAFDYWSSHAGQPRVDSIILLHSMEAPNVLTGLLLSRLAHSTNEEYEKQGRQLKAALASAQPRADGPVRERRLHCKFVSEAGTVRRALLRWSKPAARKLVVAANVDLWSLPVVTNGIRRTILGSVSDYVLQALLPACCVVCRD